MLKMLATIQREDGSTLNIVNRGTPYQPFVVCWNFDGKEWDMGTYCGTHTEAKRIFYRKIKEFGFLK